MNRKKYSSLAAWGYPANFELLRTMRSRSGLYRDAAADPEIQAQRTMHRVFGSLRRRARKATLDGYCRAAIFSAPGYQRDPDGHLRAVPGVSPEHVQQRVLRSERQAHAEAITAARHRDTVRKRAWARVLLAFGECRADVARVLHVTPRRLRKLLQT